MKFSKESKNTFLCLLIIPLVWVVLNHFGYLDFLKTKSLDWRLQFRGEIKQEIASEEGGMVQVEDNKSLPRIPKVTYVNFDASTLAMDGVGERPWDRAFFRDTALALIERGNARVLGFDFGFTPKSMSKMVPRENSYRSDDAIGELVKKYPDRVVLGCLYSGVPTQFVKPTGVSAFPPFFYDGFSLKESVRSEKYHYPESPTYPLLSYQNGKYLGRVGSFTVPPFRAVDEIPRWVPLWFPSMGKAHAYNLLGGKQSKLDFELPQDNQARINELEIKRQKLITAKEQKVTEITKASEQIAKLQVNKEKIDSVIAELEDQKNTAKELKKQIITFQSTLQANQSLATVITPQINQRTQKLNGILVVYLSDLNRSLGLSPNETSKAESRIDQLDQEILNFQSTLSANPAIAAIIKPQLEKRISEKEALAQTLAASSAISDINLNNQQQSKALGNLETHLAEKNEESASISSGLAKRAGALVEIRTGIDDLNQKVSRVQRDLLRLKGKADTELIESNQTLRLVYKASDDEKEAKLVDSLPNEVPLRRDRNVYALGVESLLAYYGLDEKSVTIDQDGTFQIRSLADDILVSCKMEEGQFLEVNWFTQWTENLEERKMMKDAKKAYSDGDFQAYTRLVPSILEKFLNRVDGVSVTNSTGIIGALKDLELESSLIEMAENLLGQRPDNSNIPGFDDLTKVVEAIAYYFIPPSLQSKTNPMCGMRDVLQNAKFQDQVTAKIKELENKIDSLQGPSVMGKILTGLEADPGNESILLMKKQVDEAIEINTQNWDEQEQELQRINSFFACFKDSIVLLGPEEKTFQDLAPTPLDKASVPKVSVHGNLIKTMTTGKYITRPHKYVDHVATVLVCLVMGLLSVYQGNKASLVQAAGILILVGFVVFGLFTFSNTHFLLPITTPACAGLSTSFIGLAAMVVIEQKAKGKLKGMFGSYVSSDLVEQMVDSGEEPSLGGEETAITAFFSDVQAFSSFSELLTPTGLVDLMNEYLTAMTNILQEERGTLDKYIGDAIVAMYGAPIPMQDHAYQSVRTAILMQQKQIELRDKWKLEADKWGKCHGLVSQMQTRIGCNTGTATVGNMGALDRFNYTMMGDMVNLAARCESGAKAYGAYIMITEETKFASESTKDDIAFRYLDKIVVKGRSQPVAMYEPTGFMSELTQETQDCLDCFRQGIDKYLLQDWDGALNLFEKAKEMEPNKPGVTPGVKDNPSMILIDRCKVMKENPPEADWDGVYVMTTK